MYNPYFIEDKTKTQELSQGHKLIKKEIRGSLHSLTTAQLSNLSLGLCYIWTFHRTSYYILLVYYMDDIMVIEPNEQVHWEAL